ncbi:sulfatase [Draconibacterium sediminis]|uniref:Aryl-sulfate sulfohydrolase n=1 Tax=Draconibacterium sediminis TaxID=1544798 RepID=A0A0D8JEM3_9BACT|nr:sulfatase [Draconibacterium sediminis]KJF45350.1 aryl-sulfate sulfohydrolase [Draconibacterium sediminis]
MKISICFRLLAGTIFLLLQACSVSNKNSITKTPNVIFIMVDDLGWTDTGFMGSDFYETPNLDEMASESLVFTNAYAGAANCAPSRACLMSGMNSPRTGVFTVSPSDRGNAKTRKLVPIENTEFLADSVVTMAEMFKSAGYITGNFGKWHIGEDPTTQGFDMNVGGGRYGHPKNYYAPYKVPDISAPEGEYLTDRLTNEAIRFIENNSGNKFFLYLPFYTVHTPIQPKQAIKNKYIKKKISGNHDNPAYAAMIEVMDYNIGRILKKLQQLKLEDNTLIVFTSDNGGLFSVSKQYPMRAGKGSYYEGGIRVPLMIKWPGTVRSGKTDMPVTNLDFYPTFEELLGTGFKTNQPVDGNSLIPMLKGGVLLPERPIFFHFPIYLQGNKQIADETRDPLFRTRPGSVVRKGNWKLHYYYEDQAFELYNLAVDIGETKNLVDEYPEVKKELERLLNDWLKETKAPLPTKANPFYDASFEKEAIQKNSL